MIIYESPIGIDYLRLERIVLIAWIVSNQALIVSFAWRVLRSIINPTNYHKKINNRRMDMHKIQEIKHKIWCKE